MRPNRDMPSFLLPHATSYWCFVGEEEEGGGESGGMDGWKARRTVNTRATVTAAALRDEGSHSCNGGDWLPTLQSTRWHPLSRTSCANARQVPWQPLSRL